MDRVDWRGELNWIGEQIMPKLYKAVDGRCSRETVKAWLVNDSAEVAIIKLKWSEEETVYRMKKVSSVLIYDEPSRFKDAIDPILIAEW
jgi:hypothetical protein